MFLVRRWLPLLLIVFMGGMLQRANTALRRVLALRREFGPAACVRLAAVVVAAPALVLLSGVGPWGSGAAASDAAGAAGGGGEGRPEGPQPPDAVWRALSLRTVPLSRVVDVLLLVVLADSVARLCGAAMKVLVMAVFRARLLQQQAVVLGGGGSGGRGSLASVLGSGGGGDATRGINSAIASWLPGLTSRSSGAVVVGGGAAGLAAGGADTATASSGRLGLPGSGGVGGSIGHLHVGGGGGGGAFMAASKQQRQQSRVLTAVECAVAVYRLLLPTPVW
ncbi:hypothetical protein CHLRE_16g668451v5 [Chlamydomonas reinhardtii]|nr:uncharacterized protein CHLRE_16g668451v5 [Chlamydomonas reinhardtii]PNW71903.1 hypothetical protein CHLRE_16g668451v5 [Chlamydomonas reinhardtii]